MAMRLMRPMRPKRRWKLLETKARWLVVLSLGVSMLASGGATAQLDPETSLEDVVVLRVLGREVVALDGLGGGSRKLRLEVGESVVWSGAQGRIGVVLTNRRALGVRRGTGFRELRLRTSEQLPPKVDVGDRLAAFATSKRVLAFDGSWTFEDIGPTEQLQLLRVGSGAVLALTTRRALGLSATSSGFVETRLQVQERIENAQAGAGLAEVTTSRRVLLFSGRPGIWTEEKRALR